MCLSEIKWEGKNIPNFLLKKKTGYKYLDKYDKVYSAPFRCTNFSIGKTVHSSKGRILMGRNDGKTYPAGFHIYKNINDAKDSAYYHNGVVVEVEYDDIQCVGKNSHKDKGLTIIARKMKVLREIKTRQ